MQGLPLGNLNGILPPRTWPCGGGGRAQERGVGVSEISCHSLMYIRSMTLSVSRTLSLSLSQAFFYPRTHPRTNHSPTHSFYFSLSYFISPSLSLWCVRACVRACPSLLLSLAFALAFSLRLCICLSPSLLDTHSRTCSHTFSLIHSLINAHTHQMIKIAFIINRKRNNVVVSFGTLEVQFFMLTELRDCDLLIVVTSSTFLKREDILKEKRQLAQIIKARSPAYI